MKFFATFFLTIVLTGFAIAQSKAPTAEEILRPALSLAAKNNKNVLLIFHASWCGWCRKMDASLQDETIKDEIDLQYEIVHLTVHESPGKKALENPGALQFLQKNGGDQHGIPYWFVLDKEGKILADSQYQPGKNSGCPASKEEVAYFISVLKKTSSLTDVALEKIRKRFRENEMEKR